MRDLWRIRYHLHLYSAKLLATALVSSHLDYCNSLLYGIADIDLIRLQHVQNQLARLVTKSPPFTRSLPLLRSLHWLLVKFRILFNINLLTYKTLRKKQSVYLHSCLPYHFHPVHWYQTTIIVCQSPGSRPTQAQELFTLVRHLFGTTFRCLSIQPFQLLPLRNIWRQFSLTWPFPHRYRHVLSLVDVVELDFTVEHWFVCRVPLSRTLPGILAL